VRERFDLALYAGVDSITHNISPNDPNNPVQGQETGFKVALDLESHRHTGDPHYFLLEGAYSTAFDTYFLLGRVGHNRNGTILGVEGWLLGDETGNAQRLGAFVSFERQVRADLLAEFTISGGYQWVDENGRDCGSFFGSEGAYATLNVTFAFGREQRHVPMK
jgi:Cellulose biosynthesis protein BcsS